jgi:beta-N-acetylhexosaminidase
MSFSLSVPLPVIFGVSSYDLSDAERKFFAEANPLGFILFTRNIKDPDQLRELTASMRDLMGRDVPILIDQEGGRVARMGPPHWPKFPAAKIFGDLNAVEAAYDNAAAIAQTVRASGINVNCAPVLDVLFPETHPAIGDRAFSDDPEIVARLGAAVIKAHLDHGVIPVVKHMPGQGRANLDSHMDLPTVSSTAQDIEKVDLFPYREIMKHEFAQGVWGMVSHILYSAYDPEIPATCSPAIIQGVIRQGLGFNGFLLSDDIVMNALSRVGDMAKRTEAALHAGCDAVLHCNGVMTEMEQIAAAGVTMTSAAAERFTRGFVSPVLV